jgi:prepilin-type N-terminal cleavage/methylation domain-containing protein
MLKEAIVIFKKSQKKRGFSFPEIVLALAIIAGVMGSFVTLGIVSLRTLKVATDYYSASLIARNQVERLRAMDFDAAALSSEIPHAVDELGNVDINGTFLRETSVTNLTSDLLQIEVEVHFPSKNGESAQVPFVISTKFSRGLHR